MNSLDKFLFVLTSLTCLALSSAAAEVIYVSSDACAQLRALHAERFDKDEIARQAQRAYLAGVSQYGSFAGGRQAKQNYLNRVQQLEMESLMNIAKYCS